MMIFEECRDDANTRTSLDQTYRKSKQKAGLANTRVANKYKFKEIIAGIQNNTTNDGIKREMGMCTVTT